jgi:hypothetical protein
MDEMQAGVEAVLARLAKDVETAVHAMYRREVGPNTAKVRTDHLVADARARLASALPDLHLVPPPASPRFSAAAVASPSADSASFTGWTADEKAAITKCIMGWLPMGPPASAKADSRCLAPGKELIPNWGERELARDAVQRVPVR